MKLAELTHIFEDGEWRIDIYIENCCIIIWYFISKNRLENSYGKQK